MMDQSRDQIGGDVRPDKSGRFLPRILSGKQYLYAVVLFTAFGVVGGYTYYALVGCNTGSCAITSNPYMSMAWGGLLGYLMPDFFVKKEK